MEQSKEKSKKVIIIAVVIAVIIAVIAAVGIIVYQKVAVPANTYQNALELYSEECFDEAIAEFEQLGDYKDSQDKIAEIRNEKVYSQANAIAESQDLTVDGIVSAIELFSSISDYKDSKDKISNLTSLAVTELDNAISQMNFDEANALLAIENVKNAVDYESYNNYISAVKMEEYTISKAYDLYKTLSEDFFDTKTRMERIEIYLPYVGTYKITELTGASYYNKELLENETYTMDTDVTFEIYFKDGYAYLKCSDFYKIPYMSYNTDIAYTDVPIRDPAGPYVGNVEYSPGDNIVYDIYVYMDDNTMEIKNWQTLGNNAECVVSGKFEKQ